MNKYYGRVVQHPDDDDDEGADDDGADGLTPDEERAILQIAAATGGQPPPRSILRNSHTTTIDDAAPPEQQPHPQQLYRQQSSVVFVSTVQQLDIDGGTITRATTTAGPAPPRLSVLRRQSFVQSFVQTKGPPQIVLLMFIIAIALGSTIGVVPAVMTDRFARLNHGYGSSTTEAVYDAAAAPDCSSYTDPNVLKPEACLLGSADAQTAVSTANLISNALTFATSSLMGSLSDEYGRRGILILGFALATIPPFLLVLTQLLSTMSPWWYYSASASTGFVNGIAISLSCIADVLPQQYRAPGIGLLLAGFMLGFSCAPIFSLLLSRIHLSIMSFLLVWMGWLCTVFIVPETLPPNVAYEARRRRKLEMARHEHDSPLLKMKRTLTRPIREMAILNRNHFFRLISSLAFFSGMVSSGDQVLLIYYLEERLAFTNGDISVMFMIMGLMGLFAQAVVLKPLNDRIGEKLVVAVAFLCGAIDNTMYGLAQNKRTIFAAVAISGLTGMAFPTISAIKANNVDVSEQGRIQGALFSLQALASGIGPVMLRYVYGQTKDSALGPGSMFLFASCLYLVAVVIACALPKEKANASRLMVSEEGDGEHSNGNDLGRQEGVEYTQLTSDSSCSDEDDYGTMPTTTTTRTRMATITTATAQEDC